MTIPRTPLDGWIARRLVPKASAEEPENFLFLENRKDLEKAQEKSLRTLLRQAATQTAFYRDRLRGLQEAPLEELPFTFPRDLAEGELRFLGVSRSRIQRRVSLSTSGSRGLPKRLGFTREDLQNTEDFFLSGMSTFTDPGSTVGIFMEGPREYSIGDLLRRALERMGCIPRIFGIVTNPFEAAAWMDALRPQVVVGLPAQMAWLAGETRWAPEKVLLSADAAPPALRKRIQEAWQCEVFNHYGLAESGWGCAVECFTRKGCHLRELDLLVEIVNPRGKVLSVGDWGEVVLTTLTRPSFPLLRYRTGDRGRLLPGNCPCGSPLKRLEVTGRLPIEGARGEPLRLEEAENALWRFSEIRDFSLFLRYGEKYPEALIATLATRKDESLPLEKMHEALDRVRGIPSRITFKHHPGPFLEHKSPKRCWNG